MTGNIIGEEFENYVFNQINLRQSAQGKGLNSNRNPQTLQYLSNTNAFLKLASSVNIQDGYGVERLGKIIGNSDAEKYKGYNLSKNAILFNGLTSLENGTYTQRAGVSKTSSLIWNNNVAYGLGGSNFGLQPMPGIIDANVRTLNRGSIRKAQITLKAFNRYQFEIIELLYLRLGFTMMLEWGHNKYITSEDENGNIQVEEMLNTLIEETWFTNQGITQLEMLDKIEEKRESYLGNYDGFFGKVSNFEWSFESDGSYTIRLDLITLGDVIESLRINDPLPSYQVKKIQKTKEEAKETKEDSLFKDLQESPIVTSAENNVISAWLFNSIADDKLWGDNNEYNDYFNLINSTKNLNIPESDKSKIKPQYSYFVTLGELLNKVNEYIIPLITNNNVESPIIGIYNSPTNNYIKYFPNQYSIDPRICIIKPIFGGGNFIGFSPPSYFNNLKNYVGQTDKAIYGQLMNVYLNYDFISKCIISSTTTNDNTTSISLYTFLEKICNGINNALGGVNKIEPIVNKDYFITLIDQNPIPGLLEESPKESIVDLEVYGYNKDQNTSNFVKSIDFQTKITPDLATQITIGATAAGSSVKNEDATTFSKWSEGLVDRFNQKYSEPLTKNLNNPTESDFIKEAEEVFENFEDSPNRVKETKRANGKTIYKGAAIPPGVNGKIKLAKGYGIKGTERLNFGQFSIYYQQYYINQRKSGVLTQSEFNNIYTTDWSYYTSECFAGNISYEVETNKAESSSSIVVDQTFGRTITRLETSPKVKTTKNVKTDSHRYLHFDPSFISRANNVYRNYLISWYKNLYNNTPKDKSPSPLAGFIPVTFNLTTQGISGIKIYNKLNINQQFLPKQYPEALKFLITGIDHIISNNTWETNLSTLSIPNTKPDENLQQLITDIDPKLTDFGIGAAQPDNTKEFVIQANIQTITTPIDNVRDVSQGIRLQKVNVFQRNREDYKIVTIDETLELFNPTARTPFRGFFEELARDYKGYTLYVNDVFRTFKESQDIYDTQMKALAEGNSTFEPAPPGTSDHNFGLAIDFNIKTPQNTFLTSLDPSGWRKHAIDRVAKNNGIEWGIAKDYVHFWYKG